MASLKEIKTRIASVQSTRKITSAMKMVASSKLHHAQNAIESMLPYEAMLEHILKTFLVSTPDTDTPFDEERPVKRVALLVFSSNSSLCGGFNANVIKLLQQTIDEYHAKGLTDKDIVIYPVGRKVFEAAKKRGYECVYPYPQLADKPNSEECRNIAKELGQNGLKVSSIRWKSSTITSKVLVARSYNVRISYLSTLKRNLMRTLCATSLRTSRRKAAQDYLKKKGQTETQKSNSETVTPLNDDFIIEPDLHTVLTSLVPKLLHLWSTLPS